MAKPTYTAPPNDAPSLGSPDFATNADGYLGWFPVFGAYIEAMADWLTNEYVAALSPGSKSAPSLSWAADSNTGLYNNAANSIAVTTGNFDLAIFNQTAITLYAPIAGSAVQSNTKDKTSGRLLKTGAFGLGDAIELTPSDDLDTLAGSGLYFNPTAGNTPGNNYPISSAGSLLNIRRTSTNWTQTFTSYPGESLATQVKTFTRSWGGSGWSPWVEVFNQGSILRAVSQASGVPTGGVMERGSNANGGYERLADGTQRCWVSKAASSGGAATWTFPAAFSAAPIVTGNAIATVTSSVCLDAAPGSTSATFSARDKTDARRADTCHLVAHGSWF